MSQFDQPDSSPNLSPDTETGDRMPRTSGLAVASLVCSLICCLPITTIPGVILGVVALAAISKNPHLSGRGLAIAGIVLGIIFTIGQGVIGLSIHRGYVEFRDTPAQILEPGFAGDYTALRENFGTPGQRVSDEQARAFIDELRNRYGELRGSDIDWDAYRGYQGPQPGATSMEFYAVLVFDRERVDIAFTMDFEDMDRHDRPVLASIRLIDPDRGDLEFPPPNGEPDDEEADAADESADQPS